MSFILENRMIATTYRSPKFKCALSKTPSGYLSGPHFRKYFENLTQRLFAESSWLIND